MKARADGILLREAVWPYVQSLDKFPQVLEWGTALAFTYRCANRENDACSIEEYIWQRLAHTEPNQKSLDWANTVILRYHSTGKGATALSMQWEIWERVKGTEMHFSWGLDLANLYV